MRNTLPPYLHTNGGARSADNGADRLVLHKGFFSDVLKKLAAQGHKFDMVRGHTVRLRGCLRL